MSHHQERDVLLNHLDQAEKLQTDAEKEADLAINQLEEIINDQEDLVSVLMDRKRSIMNEITS